MSLVEKASRVPALPDPAHVVLAEIPAVCTRIATFREWADGNAEELLRGLKLAEAIEKLCSKRADQDAIRTEQRLLEASVGRTLGPPQKHGKQIFTSEDLRPNDRVIADWRLMGEHPELVDEALEAKKTRRKPLVAFLRKQLAKGHPIPTNLDLRTGRFQDVLADVEPGSVDLILTDPPYAAVSEPDWHDLGEWAAERLKPGGSLITYVGQGTLPMALRALDGPLRYWWTLAVTHSAGAQQLPGKFVLIKWKPLLWFVRDKRNNSEQVSDLIAGIPPDKSLHEWAQGADELRPLIEKLTSKGDLIVDPFAGSASFGLVAVDMGRQWIGADDPSQRP